MGIWKLIHHRHSVCLVSGFRSTLLFWRGVVTCPSWSRVSWAPLNGHNITLGPSNIYKTGPINKEKALRKCLILTLSSSTSASSSAAVNSCALAKLSTAIAKNTFSSVSEYLLRISPRKIVKCKHMTCSSTGRYFHFVISIIVQATPPKYERGWKSANPLYKLRRLF